MKNKYFYPIYKLKIKSWIKYWLIKQTEFKGVLSDILEGTSFYLTDCLNMKFKIFDIIGRSVQDGDPTPENPVPIKNTGDNGSVNEKVQNKNLFDENAVTFTTGVLDDNGNPTGSTASHYTNNFYQVTPNTNYTLKGTLNTGSSSGRIYYYGKDKKWISRSESFGSNQKTFTTPEKCYYIKIQVVVSITLKTGDVQLEQNSTATSYVPHEEQNPSFPLSSGQKLMQGDYPADDEKVHHVRKQFTLDGSQLMSKFIYDLNLSTTNYNCFLYDDNEIKQATNDTEVFVLADKLKGTPSNQRTSDMANCWINHLSAGQLGMHVPNTITNTTELRTWLTENPITFEVLLAEEQTEDFTEEQKTAWEEIKKARTYKNVTHISSEDETPAELKIQYWKEV